MLVSEHKSSNFGKRIKPASKGLRLGQLGILTRSGQHHCLARSLCTNRAVGQPMINL
jgi:hypothetical protein